MTSLIIVITIITKQNNETGSIIVQALFARKNLGYANLLASSLFFTQGQVKAEQMGLLLTFSIITQVIIEIIALSLAENGVIFLYNHLRRGDYSGRTNFQNCRHALCRCVFSGN